MPSPINNNQNEKMDQESHLPIKKRKIKTNHSKEEEIIRLESEINEKITASKKIETTQGLNDLINYSTSLAKEIDQLALESEQAIKLHELLKTLIQNGTKRAKTVPISEFIQLALHFNHFLSSSDILFLTKENKFKATLRFIDEFYFDVNQIKGIIENSLKNRLNQQQLKELSEHIKVILPEINKTLNRIIIILEKIDKRAFQYKNKKTLSSLELIEIFKQFETLAKKEMELRRVQHDFKKIIRNKKISTCFSKDDLNLEVESNPFFEKRNSIYFNMMTSYQNTLTTLESFLKDNPDQIEKIDSLFYQPYFYISESQKGKQFSDDQAIFDNALFELEMQQAELAMSYQFLISEKAKKVLFRDQINRPNPELFQYLINKKWINFELKTTGAKKIYHEILRYYQATPEQRKAITDDLLAVNLIPEDYHIATLRGQRGTFAKKRIEANTIIGFYTGVIMDPSDISTEILAINPGIALTETDTQAALYKKTSDKAQQFYFDYPLPENSSLLISAYRRGNPIMFINASDHPQQGKVGSPKVSRNIQFVLCRINNYIPVVYAISTENIDKDQQLFTRYYKDYWNTVTQSEDQPTSTINRSHPCKNPTQPIYITESEFYRTRDNLAQHYPKDSFFSPPSPASKKLPDPDKSPEDRASLIPTSPNT